MKTTVIYHSADFDGIFCREIARKFIPDVELIGWNFGDPPLMTVQGLDGLGEVVVMDLPVDEPFGFKFQNFKRGQTWRDYLGDKTTLMWIDHHKSSIETHPRNIPGYRIDGVAACRLAWQWFAIFNDTRNMIGLPSGIKSPLPPKDDFVNRKVQEPLSVRLAGEYDIWDKRDPAAETFQYGIRCFGEQLNWPRLFDESEYVESVIEAGQWAQRYAQKMDSDLVKSKSYRLRWEGLDFLVLNTGRFNSLTFSALDKPETGHDALMGYMFNGKVWTVSLYHSNHRKDIDLSDIAVKYGGGGHKGACGFTCKTLPFNS